MRRRCLVFIFIFIIFTFWIPTSSIDIHAENMAPSSGVTTRVSIASDGTEGDSNSFSQSISSDGRYAAFWSYASNLVSGDTNEVADVFVHDRQNGTTTRVSVASDGTQGNYGSVTPSISADGRYVAFSSFARNLVSGDTNNKSDVFIHDRQNGTTTRVSVASDGTQGNKDSGASNAPSISADGRYVAFVSQASNLVSADTNGHQDIFVHDRQTGTTTRVSVASNGIEGDMSSHKPSISADGRLVAFFSEASNLVSGDTNEVVGIYVHDRQTGTTSLISVSSDGTKGNASSEGPSISADGRYVAFESKASNLVSGDTNEVDDVFVHDRQNGTTTRVSVASDGTQGNYFSGTSSCDSAISANGRYVAFYSAASNLVSDNDGGYEIYVHDRQAGTTTRISVTNDGTPGNGNSSCSSISANGRYVLFESDASNLVNADTNGYQDVFVHERLGDSKKWTMMFYLDGDNNLDNNYEIVMNQLESVANNTSVNIIVAWDRAGNNDSAYYYIKYDQNLNQLAQYTNDVDRWLKDELNMGNPSTLSDFIQWARIKYPAQQYALFISNHGTGLNGTAKDETNSNDWITIQELGIALSTATENGSNKIDVVFADSCLMAMIEDAYQIKDYANYYVASENLIWIPINTSGPYNNYISGITETTSPQDFSNILLSQYETWLDTNYPNLPYTLSSVNLGQIDGVITAIKNLAVTMTNQMSTYSSSLATSRTEVQKFDSTNNFRIQQNDQYVDLYHLAERIKFNISDQTIQDQTQEIINSLDNFILDEVHKSGEYSGPETNGQSVSWDLSNSHGISIFYPPNKSSFYNITRYNFAEGGTLQQSEAYLNAIQTAEVQWAPMLNSFFLETQPNGQDTTVPPELIAVWPAYNIYLPMTIR